MLAKESGVLITLPSTLPDLTWLLQAFTATFQKTSFAEGEWQAQLHAPEPPFTLLSVADLIPEEHRGAYEEAGGDLL